MIKNKTVFILGAGASKPYGYPIGEELKTQIIELHRNPKFMDSLDRAIVLPPDSIHPKSSSLFLSLVKELSNCGGLSIDKFMADNDRYETVCRYAITFILLNIQKENQNRPPKEDWYEYLYREHLFDRAFEEILTNQVSFITFNYDVSLDNFFLEAIRSKFPNREKEFFQRIEILHLHGKIQPLPWEPKLHFGPLITTDIARFSRGINFVHESNHQESIVKAQTILKKASNVFFMGFRFLPENMTKLNIDWVNHTESLLPTTYLGTSYQLEDGQVQKIFADNNIKRDALNLINCDCLSFLKKYAHIL